MLKPLTYVETLQLLIQCINPQGHTFLNVKTPPFSYAVKTMCFENFVNYMIS